jgi:hypothetical protein
MSLSIGIVGLPNVGKSTLFNALTEKQVAAENYPFCTIDPSVGVVAVPDPRLDQLAQLSHSAKRIYPIVEFVDIAGLVKGASEGEGLGNQFLANIRQVDAIAQVVRIFESGTVHHVSGEVNPLRDIDVINMELILADLQTIEKRLASIERNVKRREKEAEAEQVVLVKLKGALENEELASTLVFTDEELAVVRTLHLLTMKPTLYVLNRQAGGRNLDDMNDTRFEELLNHFKKIGATYCVVDAAIEQELSSLSIEEKQELRNDLELGGESGVDELISRAYEMLGLMTYFTTGVDETRGWTIHRGSSAPEAGAAIHTDFRDKFIRAEVIHCDDLLRVGSYAAARDAGLVRTEGKEYIVKEGDVIEFRI